MKLNVKLLSLTFVLFTGLLFVSCANEESASNESDTPATSMENSPATLSQQSAANQTSTMNRNVNADMSTNHPNPGSNASAGPTTTIAFDTPTHDFGTLTSGEKAKYKYEFVNTGNEPLIISNVKASCGCTAPSYSKEPIAPGDKGFIDVEYSATGSGDISKNVTITANTEPANTMIYLKAHVVK